MWAAQLLTVSRIPLGVLFWLTVDDPRAAFAVMAVAALTDILDGGFARRARRAAAARGISLPPGPGAWLDPLCDKFFVLSVLAATYWKLEPPAYQLLAIATREIILIPLAAVYRLTPCLRARMRYDFRAGALGKAATVAQFLAVAALLFRHPARAPLAVLAGAIGLLAALHYVQRGVRLARRGAAAT